MKTIDISYLFKKVGNKVYKFVRYGKGKWEVEETPLRHEPYIYFKYPEEQR